MLIIYNPRNIYIYIRSLQSSLQKSLDHHVLQEVWLVGRDLGGRADFQTSADLLAINLTGQLVQQGWQLSLDKRLA